MKKIEEMAFGDKITSKGFEIVKLDTYYQSLESSNINREYQTNCYSLLYVDQGQCRHEIDFIDYTVMPGETLVISSSRIHKIRDIDKIQGYLVMFTEGFMCEFLSNHGSGVKDLFKHSHLNPHIKSTDLYGVTISGLLDLVYSMYVHKNHVIDEKVIATTLQSLAQIMFNVGFVDEVVKAQNNGMFVQFTTLVEENLDCEKSVEAYANMMHVSEKTVNQVTRRAIDMSAKQYIIKQLIQKIRLKLSFEQKSISEIAYQLGFSEASNMTRIFKKNTGMSPKEFRRTISTNRTSFFRSDSSDLGLIKDSVEVKVYHVPSDAVVPLHEHASHDEVFYCIQGSGYGILGDGEVVLNVGSTFIAQAGMRHSLRSDTDLYVAAFLVPVIEERND